MRCFVLAVSLEFIQDHSRKARAYRRVVANAGVEGNERWLEDTKTQDGELQQPEFPAINVNLIGVLYSIPKTLPC